MKAKKLLGSTVSVLLLIGVTILSWKFCIHFLNLYGISRLITFCAIDFVLDIIALIFIAKTIINNVEK